MRKVPEIKLSGTFRLHKYVFIGFIWSSVFKILFFISVPLKSGRVNNQSNNPEKKD